MKKYNTKRISLFLLRISMGWLFFYAGITKVLNPVWSASGYLNNAKTFTGLFSWLASPAILPYTNFVNQWGLTLLGISLILGIFVRYISLAGVLMMFLYYLPILSFPYVGANSFLVDQHIIYILSLLVLVYFGAGDVLGLDKFLKT